MTYILIMVMFEAGIRSVTSSPIFANFDSYKACEDARKTILKQSNMSAYIHVCVAKGR